MTDISTIQARNIWKQYEAYDPVSGEVRMIADFHSHINAGRGFAAAKDIEGLEQGSTRWVIGEIGDKPITIVSREVTIAEGKLEVTLYEDAEHTEHGDDEEIDTYALNRTNTLKSSGLTLIVPENDPNVEEATTFLPYRIRAGEAVAGRDIPQATMSGIPWTLKPNTTYALELKNVGNSTIDWIEILWAWYWLP